MGAALGDALSEISKLNAERDYAIKYGAYHDGLCPLSVFSLHGMCWRNCSSLKHDPANPRRSFQQEVQQRADREKERRTGLSFGADPTAPTSTARQPAQFSSARTPTARRSQSPPNNIDSVAAPDVQVLLLRLYSTSVHAEGICAYWDSI